jgi:hypothetical protein
MQAGGETHLPDCALLPCQHYSLMVELPNSSMNCLPSQGLYTGAEFRPGTVLLFGNLPVWLITLLWCATHSLETL